MKVSEMRNSILRDFSLYSQDIPFADFDYMMFLFVFIELKKEFVY